MIEQFITIAIFALFIGTLEMMFQMYMQPNMILYPWSVLLAKISSKGETWRHLMRPLGRCRFCNAIWITFYAYWIVFGFDLPMMLLAFGLVTTSVELLGKYIFPTVDASGRTDAELGYSYMHFDADGNYVMKNTPWQNMLKSYVILGAFYFTVYVIIPILIF